MQNYVEVRIEATASFVENRIGIQIIVERRIFKIHLFIMEQSIPRKNII